ncbi:peptidyl-prolyl cis-trans isomerase B (cyclophilin B) [Motilibacter peucedani]|uniref:Peptidyl-prolyl cis-trans isomerase n=1 Tax=Motilibacter peucedani TaxID=598650 RepID=A0A420XSD5_9ACTN|nr:peptidylprolyl isomerase [Motilibacter peucedani]RKS77740.1 peptidyl-prolyl cis-trans isomerase B (cyclophilin B) [Motilibacter peucedani]
MAGSSKRERQLARERYVRQQQRRAQQRARRRQRQQVLGAVVAVVAVLAGVAFIGFLVRDGGDDDTGAAGAVSSPQASTSTESSAPPVAIPVAGCTDATAKAVEKPSFSKEPALTVAKTSYTATLATNCGDVVLTLDGAKAPRTVNSFAFLAGKKYFDGTACHRLTTSGIYVLQCGDPSATGSGTPGYSFPDENLPAKTSTVYKAGTVAMANSGPGTNGSQFFLVYKDSTLGPNYSVFGTITKGLDVLTKVAGAGSDSSNGEGDGKPNQPVVLQTVTVKKAG